MKNAEAQRMIFMLGISPKHKGFHYLSSVLCMVDEGQSVSEAFKTIELSSSRQADRCMRYCIRYAWDGNEGSIRSKFPYFKVPPTPVELIHALLWDVEEKAEAALASPRERLMGRLSR